jgi:hypothetical protein
LPGQAQGRFFKNISLSSAALPWFAFVSVSLAIRGAEECRLSDFASCNIFWAEICVLQSIHPPVTGTNAGFPSFAHDFPALICGIPIAMEEVKDWPASSTHAGFYPQQLGLPVFQLFSFFKHTNTRLEVSVQ